MEPTSEYKMDPFTKNINHYKEVPNSNSHTCFGCSGNNRHGLQMKFFTDEHSVFSSVIVPDHLGGYTKIVHGGVVSTILDEIMGWAGIYLLKKITMTKNMSIDFLQSVYIGEKLWVEGNIVEQTGRNQAVIDGIIYNHKGEPSARSRGTFALLTSRVAVRLGIMSPDEIENFL